MKPRTRTRSSFGISGRVTYPPNTFDQGPWPYQTTDWRCEDFIEKKHEGGGSLTPPSDLMLRKTSFQPPFFSYRLSSLVDGILYYNMTGKPCYPGDTAVPSDPPLGWAAMEGTTSELTAKLLANSNPFRYSVSIPVMIAELVEASSLLKLASANFATLIGSAHLNQVFGWDTLKADIVTLTSITTAIENRIKEFNAIVEKGGSRRREYLTNGHETGSPFQQPIVSIAGYGNWDGTTVREYRTKVWGSVRWVPNRANPIDLHKLTSFNEAAKIVLDWRNPDASTVWEAIPFSWLVDYFVNVGDTLQALEDTDKVVPTDICIMRRRQIISKTTGIEKPEDDWPWKREQTFTGGTVIHEVKLRNVVSPDDLGDLLSFGIMSKGQATNLFALLLSLARFKR